MRRFAPVVLPTLLVVALVGCLSACGSGGWTVQSSSATGEGLNAVAFANASDGWAVGFTKTDGSFFGTILATTNGGTTWKAQTSGAAAGTGLNAVAFANASDGWAVGFANTDGSSVSTILATTDGGATWKAQKSGAVPGTALNGVAFANASDGWAAGIGTSTAGLAVSTILATRNGGATWKVQNLGAAAAQTSLSGVACANASDGWAVGQAGGGVTNSGLAAGIILATTNGGATWTAQDPDSVAAASSLQGVAFANPSDGWAVGAGVGANGVAPGRGIILATTDGGATWKVQSSGVVAGTVFNGVAFANASDGWAAGVGGGCKFGSVVSTILATTDGGATWKAQKSGAVAGAYLQGVAFANASDGLAVGFKGGVALVPSAKTPPYLRVILATANGGR